MQEKELLKQAERERKRKEELEEEEKLRKEREEIQNRLDREQQQARSKEVSTAVLFHIMEVLTRQCSWQT